MALLVAGVIAVAHRAAPHMPDDERLTWHSSSPA